MLPACHLRLPTVAGQPISCVDIRCHGLVFVHGHLLFPANPRMPRMMVNAASMPFELRHQLQVVSQTVYTRLCTFLCPIGVVGLAGLMF